MLDNDVYVCLSSGSSLHSDYVKVITDLDIGFSMTEQGDPYENAIAEDSQVILGGGTEISAITLETWTTFPETSVTSLKQTTTLET